MPIFNNDLTFIHIPKCGGTSIESFLVSLGWKMSLFTATGSVFINGHTPQHCTYRELTELNLIGERVFTVVRPDLDRCVSEYFYIQRHRPDLKRLFDSFDGFLDLFLDGRNTLLFDYHNLPAREFIIDRDGKIDPSIEVIDFYDVDRIESFLQVRGLTAFHEMRSDRTPGFTPNQEQQERIRQYFSKYDHQP
jgi:hypothetical protein